MIKKLLDLLTKQERKRAGLLLGIVVVSLTFTALTRDNVFSTKA